jgi:two-component system CheB/CheR fusion protein
MPPSDQDAADPEPSGPLRYVGIGASAGGLEAIGTFFASMRPDTGLTFVVVQHLSPDHKSLMPELLSKRTSMPVVSAEDGVQVRPDSVYLIPPRKNLSILQGRLVLSDPEPSSIPNLPIDVFLRSLAQDQGPLAVGIILSGTGSDGLRGVRAIKESGGMVMVQSPESAKFDGMPRAALSTGLVDFVVAPQDMPEQLLSYLESPGLAADPSRFDNEDAEDDLTRILVRLRDRCHVDFTFYKMNTVLRRIERRMMVNQVTDLAAYYAHMSAFPAEVDALYRELLIGVTNFFRDPEVFEALEQRWLTELLAIDSEPLRLWVAGCSTGEEAYSLAILLYQAMEASGNWRDVKIFATDVDREAIVRAQRGVYPESIAADVGPERLSRFFYKRDDSFQVARQIREMVVFAQHNVVRDPPFANIHLVSCRNLLIYLQPVLQQKVLELFSFSLRSKGMLLLGTSETTGDLGRIGETNGLFGSLV